MAFFPKKIVIVPVDFSDTSLQAIRVARDFVAKVEDIRAIHVLPMLSPMDPGIVWEAWNDDTRRKHAREALEQRLEADLKGITIDVLIGDPAREVAARATEIGADLIVLPSHGRTGPARLLIGSVAERIVRHAHCPVLVLRN